MLEYKNTHTHPLLYIYISLFPRRCLGIYLSKSYSNVCTKFGRNHSRRSRVMLKHKHTHTHTHTHPLLYIYRLAYFPCIVWVFIYPNLIAMCVPSLVEIAAGVPELCPYINTHTHTHTHARTHTHTNIQTSIFIGIDSIYIKHT
jgi:hypothetical protein